MDHDPTDWGPVADIAAGHGGSLHTFRWNHGRTTRRGKHGRWLRRVAAGRTHLGTSPQELKNSESGLAVRTYVRYDCMYGPGQRCHRRRNGR